MTEIKSEFMNIPEIRYLIEQLQVVSGFKLHSCLRAFNRDLKRSIKILEKIVTHVDVGSNVLETLPELSLLIQISCYLFQTFLSRTKSHWVMKSNTEQRIEKCLGDLFNRFNNQQKQFLVTVSINYIRDTNSWHLEYINARYFILVLRSNVETGVILSAFTVEIEHLTETNTSEAIKVTNVLNQILSVRNVWEVTHYTSLTGLIRLYHSRLVQNDDRVGPYLGLGLTRLFRGMSCDALVQIFIVMVPLALDMGQDVSLAFGNSTLEAVIAFMTRNGSFSNIPSFLMEYLIEMIASPVPDKSCLACKILSRLFDDKGNYNEFLTPKIFYFYMTYNLNPSKPCNDDELSLILKYKKPLFQSLFVAVKSHNGQKRNLNAIYTLICTVIAKILPGSAGVTVVCLVMDMQRFSIESKTPQTVKNYVHGLVLSLMSLHCWFYRGKSLLSYMDELTIKRFAEGQPLLPSSTGVQGSEFTSKSYQNHNKTLFFDNLELRYALWKCFVTKEDIIEVSRTTTIPWTEYLNTHTFQLKLRLTSID